MNQRHLNAIKEEEEEDEKDIDAIFDINEDEEPKIEVNSDSD